MPVACQTKTTIGSSVNVNVGICRSVFAQSWSAMATLARRTLTSSYMSPRRCRSPTRDLSPGSGLQQPVRIPYYIIWLLVAREV